MPAPAFSRRDFLAASGGLVVAFSLQPFAQLAAQPAPGPKLPGSLDKTPALDGWTRIGSDGRVTVFTGKAELGRASRPRSFRSRPSSSASIPRASTS